jgi:hypothetical protein
MIPHLIEKVRETDTSAFGLGSDHERVGRGKPDAYQFGSSLDHRQNMVARLHPSIPA